jgi:hypothetical protein
MTKARQHRSIRDHDLGDDRVPVSGHAQSDVELDAPAIRQVLDDLRSVLNDRWSYRRANSADFDGAIDVMRKKRPKA